MCNEKASVSAVKALQDTVLAIQNARQGRKEMIGRQEYHKCWLYSPGRARGSQARSSTVTSSAVRFRFRFTLLVSLPGSLLPLPTRPSRATHGLHG